MTVEYNNHHILYCRKTWDKGYAKRLRNHWFMQAKIPAKELHEEIHKHLNCVPLPRPNRCKEAYSIIRDLEQKGSLKNNASLRTRIDLLLCIWGGLKDAEPTCAALRMQLAILQDYYDRMDDPRR